MIGIGTGATKTARGFSDRPRAAQPARARDHGIDSTAIGGEVVAVHDGRRDPLAQSEEGLGE